VSPDEAKRSVEKLHEKLRSEKELVKLHLKHYHMSPVQFKHRTSAVEVPTDIHQLSRRSQNNVSIV
jgi:hypothetical protein